MSDKQNQSKCSRINFEELKIQSYLVTEKLTTKQKQMLFQLRSGTYPVGNNNNFNQVNNICPCCRREDDTIQHQLKCEIQVGQNIIMDNEIFVSDIYSSNLHKQCQITMIYEQTMNRRKLFLHHMETNLQQIETNSSQ